MPPEWAADNGFTDYCGSSQKATTFHLTAYRGLPLSGSITGKITHSQDIRKLRGQLSGAPTRREDQMQVSEQGRRIDRKFDQKVVAKESFSGRYKATSYDPPLCGERVENRTFLYLMDHPVV